MKIQFDLFMAFFRVGMLGYGGGPSSIPLVHKEVVTNYKWMDDGEFADVLALGNTLPGPIATKLAGYIGWRKAGGLGMIVALLATMLPTIIIIILLLAFLANFSDKPWVQGMTNAVIPVVAVMLFTMTWNFVKQANAGLGPVITSLLIIASIIIMEPLHIHPAFIILTILLFVLLKRDHPKNPDQATSTKKEERS